MDFSWNLMVALWFVCFNPTYRQLPGMLFGVVINHDAEKKITVLRSPKEVRKPLKNIVNSKPDGLFVWQPPYINPRMYVQHSVFAFSRSQAGIVGTTNTPGIMLSSPIPDDTRYIRIGISPELKSKMKLIWENVYGYKPSTLFPDFEGFAQNWEYNNLVPG